MFEKGSCYKIQNGLKVSKIFLCKHLQCWDYMHMTTCQASQHWLFSIILRICGLTEKQ